MGNLGIIHNRMPDCQPGFLRMESLQTERSFNSLQDMATVPTVLATTVPWWPGRLGAMLPIIRTP